MNYADRTQGFIIIWRQTNKRRAKTLCLCSQVAVGMPQQYDIVASCRTKLLAHAQSKLITAHDNDEGLLTHALVFGNRGQLLA